MPASAPSLDSALQLHRAGRLAEAEAMYRDVLRREPHSAEALHLLGMLAHQAARVDEAIDSLQRAVDLSPDAAVYRSNLAGILGKAGRPEEAVPHAREAARLRPDFPEAHNNLGVALEATGHTAEAEAAFRRAVELRPGYAEAHNHLGNVLRRVGRLEQAVSSHREALRLRPGFAKAYSGLAAALAERGWLQEALDALRKEVKASPDSPAAHSALLYALHYDPGYDRPTLFQEHREWDRRHGRPLSSKRRPPENDRNPGRRLRVGYVSPDLRDHTVPRFIGEAIERHDRERFEVFCYSDARRPDAVTGQLRAWSDGWHDTHALDDGRLAELIRQDRIDVLVDLRGHGPANRLPVFARRPAPVQASMVGYFDTTGLEAMDLRVTDAVQDPPDAAAEEFHTERLIRMPAGCWCYRVWGDTPDVAEPPAVRNGFVTFGSLNKLIKISPHTARLWARVLEAVPNSRLLLAVPGADAGRLAPAWLSGLGLPLGRVDLVGKTRTRQEYLSRFNRVDVALDTVPFCGITTTCDGLWMGVPAVTLAGPTSVSRAGASIAAAAGLPELAAEDDDGYVRAAATLACDVGRLRSTRLELRERVRRSPLMDGERFTRDLEAAFLSAWNSPCCRRCD